MKLIKEFPTIQGVLITEIGLLKMDNGPATCSDTTMVSAMRKLFGIMRRSDYQVDGTSIVKHISWFSKDGDGSTYNLALADPSSGQLRPLGNAYVQECGKGVNGVSPSPSPPSPTPAPAPTAAPSGSWSPCSAGACCNPHTDVPQYCPSGARCQDCGGGNACQCPSASSTASLEISHGTSDGIILF